MHDETKGSGDFSRRGFIRATAAMGAATMVGGVLPGGAWAAGSDAPEKKVIRVGFIPLTDCASVVMAAVKGFDARYGIRIVPSKEANWAAVRDKTVSGELDASHVLYGLVYGVHLGIGGAQKDMAMLTTLNRNGQAITLAKALREAGVSDGEALKKHVAASPAGTYTFAQTFPTGTHAMWLYYWLAAHGIHPLRDVKTIVVPPPQMVANMRVGNMHGYCVGEPWNQRAIIDGIGFTGVTTQEIWPDHPEKILATTNEWVEKHPNAARALTAAIIDASRWIDASDANRRETARVIAARSYVNTDVDVIEGRILGDYDNGAGKTWKDGHGMKFFDDGKVNFPYLSDGMWFLTQHRRWGLLDKEPDYPGVARAINRIDIYRQAAEAVGGVAVPADEMRSSTFIDGTVWDGSDPAGYAGSFAVKA